MKVFSLKKYMEDRMCIDAPCWAKECDGQPVKDGMCNGYLTHDDWCEEVPDCKVIFNGKATVLIKDGKKYVSKCKDGDVYDKEKGLLLCLAQANGISYRYLQEMIAGAKDCNLEKVQKAAGKIAGAITEAVKAFIKALHEEKADDKAQVREVKRKAKVGEYIKIVAPNCTFGDYGKGDIFKVKSESYNGVDVEEYGKDEHGNEKCTYIVHEEYVVLENYTPYKITLSEFWANEGKKVMAIHCKTEDEAKELLKAFDRMGKKWVSGRSYTTHTNWESYGEKTIYDNTGGYADIGGCYHREDVKKTFEFNEVDLSK